MEFTYRWHLKDLDLVKKNGLKVFSCFACGGGSSFGYKMAGYEVIGANEIDPAMAKAYQENHHPKYFYLEDIRVFKERNDLPRELFQLDILDGSPPCSSFSMSGDREESWGVEKKFREGQQKQKLDDLFFHFLDVAEKLKPKVIIAENVKGILQGKAKGYVKEITQHFIKIGYNVQIFLLNAASMGVPQRRERVFFIAFLSDLNYQKLKLDFKQQAINAYEAIGVKGHLTNSANIRHVKNSRRPKWWTNETPAPTIMAAGGLQICEGGKWRSLTVAELLCLQSFPGDFNLGSNASYQIGMSVPPLMIYKISTQIYKQWFQDK